MKYQHSKEESAEYLRRALPLMSSQNAALHPVSYAVWYEYVAGMNNALMAATDSLLKDGAWQAVEPVLKDPESIYK